MKRVNSNFMIDWKNIKMLRKYKKNTSVSMSEFVNQAIMEKFDKMEDRNNKKGNL